MSNDFDFFKKEHLELNQSLAFVNRNVKDYESEIKAVLNGTYIKPISTGIKELDQNFNYFLGMLLLISGYPQAGKSEFARFLLCSHISRGLGKGAIFSPESDTPILITEMITTIQNLIGCEWTKAKAIVNENVIFVEIKDEIGMPDIKQMVDSFEMLNKEGYNFFVIDPMNWVTSSMYTQQGGMFESLRLTLTYLKQFAKSRKSLICYVEHPKTPTPNKDGTYSLCSIFSVNGGVMHNNKVDAALILHRQRGIYDFGKAKSSQNDPILLEIAKLKFQKYLGIPDNVLLDFDFRTGIYKAKGFQSIAPRNYQEPETSDEPF